MKNSSGFAQRLKFRVFAKELAFGANFALALLRDLQNFVFAFRKFSHKIRACVPYEIRRGNFASAALKSLAEAVKNKAEFYRLNFSFKFLAKSRRKALL
jgi:hypothetical protein